MSIQYREGRSVAKRPRPVLSCLECRRKKLKCDRMLPCQQCLKLNQPSLCTYAPGQEPEARDYGQTSGSVLKRARRDTSEENNSAGPEGIGDLFERVKVLEHALKTQQTPCATPGATNWHTPPSVIAPSPGKNSVYDEPFRPITPPVSEDEEFSLFSQVRHYLIHVWKLTTVVRGCSAICQVSPPAATYATCPEHSISAIGHQPCTYRISETETDRRDFVQNRVRAGL